MDPVAQPTVNRLGLGDAADWVHVCGLREMPGGTRLGIADLYLRAAHRAVADEVDGPVSDALLSRVLLRYDLTLAGIDQTIGAVVLRPSQARRLRAEPGEPGLRIVRRYHSVECGLLEVSVHVHPASRFEYSLHIDTRVTPG